MNTTGNDSWTGNSSTHIDGTDIGPKATIQNGSDTVDPNGFVYVADGTYTEHITINQNLNLIGQSLAGTIIDGTQNGRPLTINPGLNVNITNFTITNGTITEIHAYGGGIYNSGTLIMTNCNIQNNTATSTAAVAVGGGICNDYGTLTMTNCNINNNKATATSNTVAIANGGGIYNDHGTLTMTNCNINNNTANATTTGGHADARGGGISNSGTLTMTNCNIQNNTATSTGGPAIAVGGGIFNFYGTLAVNYSRIVGNTPQAIYKLSGTVSSLEDNWWGTNNPNFTTLLSYISAPTNWLFMTINATPSTINNTQTSLITVSFNNLFNGTTVTPYIPGVGEYIPDGTPVTFSLTNGPFGTLTAPFTGNTLGGLASILFTATNVGVQEVNGTLDEQNVTTSITILAAHVDLETFYADYNEFVNNNHNILTITDPLNYLDHVIVVFTATNMGPNPVTDLVLREDWPSQLIGTGDLWHTFDGINWILDSFLAQGSFNLYPTYAGPLNMGDVIWVVFGATVNASNTIITNTVSTTEQDPIDNEGFDTATVDLQVNPEANLTITKTGSDTVIAGTITNYTITIKNNGPDDAANVIFNDTFITGASAFNTGTVKYRWKSNDGDWTDWSDWTNPSNPLIVNLGTINIGKNATIQINGTINSSTTQGTIINNTATTNTTTTPGNKMTYKETTINTQSDVVLTKSVDNSRPDVGDTVIFTVTAHNNGPSDALNIQIQDIMPSDFTDVVITPSKGTYNNLTGIWTLNLSSGESATLNLTGKVTSVMAGKNTTNNATLIGSTQTANATIYVPKANLYIQITSNNNNPTVGETFTLRYKLGNYGPDDALNVTITIPIPDGFVISKIEGDGTWTIVGNNIIWTMNNVTVGDPDLYVSGWTKWAGSFLFGASILSDTFNLNSQGVSSFSLNAVPQVNAATTTTNTGKTLGMQTTGAPIVPLAFAVLSVLGGLVATRKKQ